MFAAALAASALFLAGCSSTGPASSTDASSKKVKIIMLLNDQFDPYYLTMVKGAEAEAKTLGIDFSWQAPTTIDVASQTALLQSIAATKPDGIIMSAVDATAMVAPMKAVEAAGVPIITVDSDVTDPSARLGTIRSNGLVGGEMAATEMDKLLGGKGDVGYVGYIPGIQSVDVRLQGWDKQLQKYSGLNNIGNQYAGADVTDNVAKASALLAKEPNIKGIFTSWTNAVIGTSQAVQQVGKSDSVKIIGFDGAPDEISLLKKGLISALIVQKPSQMGSMAVSDLNEYIKNKTKPKSETLLDFVVATKSNMTDPDISKFFYVTPTKKP